MAGDRQAASGTGFDPSPQFLIVSVDGQRPLRVIGRCWFEPIRVGAHFVALGRRYDAVWERIEIPPLSVVEIVVFGRLTGELSQTWTAELVLDGPAPVFIGDVLVAEPTADLEWAWDGALWVRR